MLEPRHNLPMRGICFLLACMAAAAQTTSGEWRSLFDGKTFAGWRETAFTGHGKSKVENGAIMLGAGGPMTGVTYTGNFPKVNYETRFEAARLDGNDFFASLTFPVGDAFCTWVTGGWGGDIVGFSSIDGWDASDNETRTYADFEKGRYYRFRLRVKADRLTAWIDDQQVIDVSIEGRVISLRPGEMKLSAPLGFAYYGTLGGVRKVEYRALP